MRFALHGNQRIALLWLLVVLAFTICVGASVEPGWWKRFLLKGGMFQAWYWSDALSVFGRGLVSFHPAALALLGVCVALGVNVVFFFGRRSAGAQDSHQFPAPPRAVLVLTAVVTPLVLFGLSLSTQEYWTAMEINRSLKSMTKTVERLNFHSRNIRVPSSGDFLYLDREKALDQYAVLNDSLSIAQETTREGAESKTGATGAVPSVGSIGVEQKTTLEKSITRTAPQVTPAVAASRLIQRFANDEGVVDLAGTLSERFQYRSILEGLEKRRVTLSPDQRAQLEKAELEDFEAKTLRLTGRRPLFFRGTISIVPGKGTTSMTAAVREPLSISISGPLKVDYLGSHVRTCFELKQPTCEVIGVTLLGVMESVESPSPRVRKVTVSPVAIW